MGGGGAPLDSVRALDPNQGAMVASKQKNRQAAYALLPCCEAAAILMTTKAADDSQPLTVSMHHAHSANATPSSAAFTASDDCIAVG